MRLGALLTLMVMLLTAVLFTALLNAGAPVASGQTMRPAAIKVTISKSDVSLQAGDSFSFSSTITNGNGAPTPRLIANLNLVSVGLDAYVDPEDWSQNRFLSIDPIASGSSQEQTWDVHAVQGGDYLIFIVVLPDTNAPADATVVGGAPVHLHVDLKRNLNPGGTLPVSLAVPAFLLFLLAGTKVMSNRRAIIR